MVKIKSKDKKILESLSKIAQNYDGNTAHHKLTTPKKRIKRLHIKRSRLRGLNHEKHLKALRQNGLQR